MSESDAVSSAKHAADQKLGVLAVLFAALVWGGQIPIAKWLFGYLDAFAVTAFRYGLPVICLASLLVFKEGWQSLDFRARNSAPWRTWLIGLTGMCASPCLVFGGLMFTRPEVASIIIASQPTLAALMLWILRGVRPAGFTLICVATAFFGVVMVVTRLDPSAMPQGRELGGYLMILSGALAWVIYTIACERFAGWSSLRTTTLTMIPGAVGNALVVAASVWFGFAHWPAASEWPIILPALLFLSFAGVLAAMILWTTGTRRIGALNAMLFLNLVPVVAFTVGFLGGSRFQPIELIGAGLVIGALIANNLYQRKPRA